LHAGRKALQITQNLENILAIELLCACQALEFRSPLAPAKPTQAALNLVRELVPTWSEDRLMHKDIEIAFEIVSSGELVDIIEAECGPLS
jgi:histidine ammonia-lyase